jgi:UDP-N-acetylglucosamine 1-carboxyvinyltransferase
MAISISPQQNAKYTISGQHPLEGALFVQGAKNAALPIIAAALFPQKGQTILHNVPPINDVFISLALAQSIGAHVAYHEKEQVVVIDASDLTTNILNPALTSKSRASVLFLPPLLHRTGKVHFYGAGGCALGVRSLDFHYNGFKRLGARVAEGSDDDLVITANDKIKGNLVYLDIPSQTSTENLMMAACLAEGETIIENAASEPEVTDFANFLSKMGAKFHGVGTRTITVEGVRELQAVEYTVMPDRLDAGSFIMAAGVTQGDVTFVGANLDQLNLLKVKLEQMGVEIIANGPLVRVKGPKRLNPVNVITWPYPGFSTDFLPPITTLATLAEGKSYIRENVFEDRFTHVEGLKQFGAIIERENGNLAIVEGVKKLHGNRVSAPDLRAGMALILGGLAAEGETVIDNVYQIERGYSNVETRLQGLGAKITRSE